MCSLSLSERRIRIYIYLWLYMLCFFLQKLKSVFKQIFFSSLNTLVSNWRHFQYLFHLINISLCKESHLTLKLDWTSIASYIKTGLNIRHVLKCSHSKKFWCWLTKHFKDYFKDICERQQKISCSHF